MKLICVNDDYPGLKSLLKAAQGKDAAIPSSEFSTGKDALDWFFNQDKGLAVLNIAEDRARVKVVTFGGFDVYVDGEVMHFKRAKAKEVLAYLVDRQGGSVTRAEIFATLYEDEEYDRARQKQFDVILRSLRDSLDEYGIGYIYEMEHATLRVVPGRIDCDMYRFLDGDEKTIESYRGEYMSSYSWAMMTEAYMDQRIMLRR